VLRLHCRGRETGNFRFFVIGYTHPKGDRLRRAAGRLSGRTGQRRPQDIPVFGAFLSSAIQRAGTALDRSMEKQQG